MRPKEVIGQSMRTTKSARPGSVVYVPMEGETTMQYIKKILENKNIKITRIATGIPMGTDIDYIDAFCYRLLYVCRYILLLLISLLLWDDHQWD